MTVKMENAIANSCWGADGDDSRKKGGVAEGNRTTAFCHHGGSRDSGKLKDHATVIDANPIDDILAANPDSGVALAVKSHQNVKCGIDADSEGVGSGVDDDDFNSLFKIPRSQLIHSTPNNPFEKLKNTLEAYEYNGITEDPLTTPKLYLPCHSSADYPSYCYSNDYYEVSLVSNTHASLIDDHESLSLGREITTSIGGYNEEDEDEDEENHECEDGRGFCCTKSESIFSRNTSFDSTLSSQYFAPSEPTFSSIESPSSIDSDLVDSLYDFPIYTYEPNPIFKSSHQKETHACHQLVEEAELNKTKLLSTNFSLSPTPINIMHDDEDHLFGVKLEVPSLLSLTNSNQIQSYVCTLENTIDDENNLSKAIFPAKPFAHEQNIATNLKMETVVKAEKRKDEEALEKGNGKDECYRAGKGISSFTATVFDTKDGVFSIAKETAHNSEQCNHSNDDCKGGCGVGKVDNKVSPEKGKKLGKLVFLEENNNFRDDIGNGNGIRKGGSGKGKKGNTVASGSKVGKGSKRGRKTRGRRPWTKRKNEAEVEIATRGSDTNEISQCKDNLGSAANGGGEVCGVKAHQAVTSTGAGAGGVIAVTTTSRPGRRNKKKKQPTVFVCKHCGKDFPRKSNHDSHIRLHLTVKPHVCQFCSKAFVRRSDMNRHERSLHLKTTFKCFGKCNRQKWGCGHLYSRKDGLRKHWKSAQGQECLREFMVLNNLTEHYHEVKDLEKIIELTHLF